MKSESLENMSLAQRIAYAVKKAGGQKSVSDDTAVSVRTVSSYTTGEAEPKISFITSLSKMSGLSIGWLADGKDALPADNAQKSMSDAKIDIEMLEKVIDLIDKIAKQRGITLDSKKRARVYALAYEYVKRGTDMDVSNVISLVELAAS